MRSRTRRIAIAIGALIGVATLVMAIETDSIRFGPSSYALPDEAVMVQVSQQRLPSSDTNPEYDYYDIFVTVWNGVNDENVHPSRLEVRVQFEQAVIFDYWPQGTAFAPSTSTLETPCNATIEVPAGEISAGSDFIGYAGNGPYHAWRVEGEVGGRSVPIFQQSAEFCLHRVRASEGSALGYATTVTLVWSYRNAVQVYPIAERTVTVGADQA